MPDEQRPPSPRYVLSYVQVLPILAAARSGKGTVAASLDLEPYRETQMEIRSLGPLTGRVLDTTTGQGHTAAARTAHQVVAIEPDPVLLEVCRPNPRSQQLFQRENTEQRPGDAFDVLDAFRDGAFGPSLYDLPASSLTDELYALAFDEKLYRAVAHRGCLGHHVGDLRSRSGAGISPGVICRLQEAGFSRLKAQPRASGLTARKSPDREA